MTTNKSPKYRVGTKFTLNPKHRWNKDLLNTVHVIEKIVRHIPAYGETVYLFRFKLPRFNNAPFHIDEHEIVPVKRMDIRKELKKWLK